MKTTLQTPHFYGTENFGAFRPNKKPENLHFNATEDIWRSADESVSAWRQLVNTWRIQVQDLELAERLDALEDVELTAWAVVGDPMWVFILSKKCLPAALAEINFSITPEFVSANE